MMRIQVTSSYLSISLAEFKPCVLAVKDFKLRAIKYEQTLSVLSRALLTMSSLLPKDLYEELGASIRGHVFLRDQAGYARHLSMLFGNFAQERFDSFEDYSTIFNGNVVCPSKAVAVPLDAEDVSKCVFLKCYYSSFVQDILFDRIVLFCVKYALSPSVKAGGYGTAGWAINGDIIIDLSKLVEVDIEVPHEDGSFTSLKDVASANSKGKKPVGSSSTVNPGKRRREDDIALRSYDMASQAVASFLRGPSSTSEGPSPFLHADGPPPNVRRRIDGPDLGTSSANVARQVSVESDSISLSASSEYDSGNFSNRSTAATSPSPPHSSDLAAPSNNYSSTTPSIALSSRRADPFGYLSPSAISSSSIPPPTVMQSAPPASMFRSWGAIANMAPTATQMQMNVDMQAQAEPVHPHAFVTFGAGMRQKEIDTYTAQHKLEARYASGDAEADGIPYHVPL
jgi:hypothetical protein